MEGADAVLHLGAFMSWLPADAARVYAANATGTFELLPPRRRRRCSASCSRAPARCIPKVRPRYLPIDEEPSARAGVRLRAVQAAGGGDDRRSSRRTQGLAVHDPALRAHAGRGASSLDPASFFSGPRFFLRSKIRQQRAFGNARALAVLEPLDDGREKLLVQCGEDGTPYRMMIADARDIADGVVLALDAPRARNAMMNLGPDEPTSLDEAVALLRRRLGLPVVRARLPGPAVNYATSNARARELLGFRPRYDFAAMVSDARVPSAAG